MLTLNQVALKLNDIVGFRGLLETYEDLAAQKMQEIRGEILGFREYAQILTLMSSELEQDISTVIKRNTKQKAALLMSSDKGLYGNAFESVAGLFVTDVSGNKMDAYVVGSVGEELVRRLGLKEKYSVIEANKEALDTLWKSLSEYQEVSIYHLKYETLAKQEAGMVHFSGDLIPKEGESYEYDGKQKLKYIYEPSAADITGLFAKEVLAFLAEQTMKESDLAKHAARLMYLDTCLQKNSDNLKDTIRLKMILTKRRSNKRQNARMINYLTRNRGNKYV